MSPTHLCAALAVAASLLLGGCGPHHLDMLAHGDRYDPQRGWHRPASRAYDNPARSQVHHSYVAQPRTQRYQYHRGDPYYPHENPGIRRQPWHRAPQPHAPPTTSPHARRQGTIQENPQ